MVNHNSTQDTLFPSTQPPPASRYSILVAEDDPLVRSLLQRVLGSGGWEVITASNGMEAVETWKQHPELKLAILDVRMPKMNGYEAYQEIRRISPQAQFLLISGYADQDIEAQIMRAERVQYIAKPFDSQTLLTTVRTLLNGRHPPQSSMHCEAGST